VYSGSSPDVSEEHTASFSRLEKLTEQEAGHKQNFVIYTSIVRIVQWIHSAYVYIYTNCMIR
jgi:hypothetical protein